MKERILTQVISCRWNVGRRRFVSHCSSSRKERMSKDATYPEPLQKRMLIARILIFLLFLCGTGTLETNLAQTRDANGKKIGKMFN